jgi:acetylornithine deacetylase/succinyl-diaminopimelate desuccinylase-like protein
LKKGVKPDCAVVTEPTSLAVSTVQAGVTELNMSTIRRTVHISSSRDKGVNAITKMAEAVRALTDLEFEHEPRQGFEGTPAYFRGASLACTAKFAGSSSIQSGEVLRV